MLTRRRARSERRWNGCSPTRRSATPQPQPPAESPRTSPTAPPSRPSSRSRPRPADRRRSLLLHPQPVSRSVASGVRGSPRADRDSAPAPRRGGLDRAHRRRRCLGDATLRPVVRVLLDPRIFGLRGEPAHAEALRLGGAGTARRRALVAGTSHLTGRDAIFESQGGESGPSVLTEALIGGLGALIILLFVFGTLPAVAMPLAMAAASILTTFACVLALTYVTNVSIIVQFLVALVGLGVAIDYALLMTFRFREELAAGRSPDDALVEMMAHAGRSVIISGSTVAIGLLS